MKKALLATGILGLSVGAFVLWPEPVVKPVPVGAPFKEKTTQEIVALVASIGSFPKVRFGDYYIQLVSTEALPNGVAVYIRAWDKNNTQIGFGPDGTVDIEKIISINPPTLVYDTNGPITMTRPAQYNPAGELIGATTTYKMREDPAQALLLDLAHTLKVKTQIDVTGKIIPGKYGRTTLTVRSVAGSVDPVDGFVYRGPVTESLATIRSGSGSGAVDNDTYNWIPWARGAGSPNLSYLARGILVFDTSSIASGSTVSSATFSQKCRTTSVGIGTPDMHVAYGVSASNSTLASGDYANNTGPTSIASHTRAEINTNCNTTAGSATFNDFTLSSYTGINMGTGARTKLSTQLSWDILNDTTGLTYANLQDTFFDMYMADIDGGTTTNDPKLVIEYSAGAAATPDDTYWTIL